MNTHFSSQPVWAGLALRFADGSVRTFEFQGHDIQADIRVEAQLDDATTAFDTFRRYINVRPPLVDIHVSGQASDWARFRKEDAVTPASEIEPARHAIEGGSSS